MDTFDIAFYGGIAVIVVIVLFNALKQPKFNPQPPPQRLQKDMTYQQLQKYHSKNNIRLIALKGVIYDVTPSDFYKQGSGYSLFTGHDASVNLAKMSHAPEFLNKYGQISLNEEQTKNLDDWVAKFQVKYLKVGKVLK